MSLPFPRFEYTKIKYLINAHNLDFYPSVIYYTVGEIEPLVSLFEHY